MKKLSFLLPFITTVALFSCSVPVSNFYQVYKVAPTEKTSLSGDEMIYEDENTKVTYDFWSENGNIGFQIFNKTETDTYLNLEESFFIFNGEAHPYFKNRVYTHSSASGTSGSASVISPPRAAGTAYLHQNNQIHSRTIQSASSAGYAVTYNEEKVICVPAKTSRKIMEYTVNAALIRDCDLFLYPSSKEIRTLAYNKANSPIVFSNRLVYTKGKKGDTIRFDNEFYIEEITNLPESQMFTWQHEVFCNEKSTATAAYWKDKAANKFYIRYRKSDGWKH